MNPAAEIWSRVVELMRPDMTTTTINTFFDDVTAVALEEDRFILYSPVRFKAEIISSRYAQFIKKALYELFSADFDVVVLTEDQLDSYQKPVRSNVLPGTEDYTFERFVVGSSNKFAHAAARAVASMNVLTEMCLPYVKVGGKFLAMKSVESDGELEQAAHAIKFLGGRVRQTEDYPVPHTDVTHRLVVIEKVAPTLKGYPRRWAKVQKAPL